MRTAKTYTCNDCGLLVIVEMTETGGSVTSHALPVCEPFDTFMKSTNPDSQKVTVGILRPLDS